MDVKKVVEKKQEFLNYEKKQKLLQEEKLEKYYAKFNKMQKEKLVFERQYINCMIDSYKQTEKECLSQAINPNKAKRLVASCIAIASITAGVVGICLNSVTMVELGGLFLVPSATVSTNLNNTLFYKLRIKKDQKLKMQNDVIKNILNTKKLDNINEKQ